jgi:hypothetical protein
MTMSAPPSRSRQSTPRRALRWPPTPSGTTADIGRCGMQRRRSERPRYRFGEEILGIRRNSVVGFICALGDKFLCRTRITTWQSARQTSPASLKHAATAGIADVFGGDERVGGEQNFAPTVSTALLSSLRMRFVISPLGCDADRSRSCYRTWRLSTSPLLHRCRLRYLFDFRRINIYFLFCRTNSVRDLIFV